MSPAKNWGLQNSERGEQILGTAIYLREGACVQKIEEKELVRGLWVLMKLLHKPRAP